MQCGAMQSIPTGYEFVQQGKVNFLVRIASSLARKVQASAGHKEGRGEPVSSSNPFLPYDEALFVTNISDTHVCLLNKFNVVEHHILIVTRSFEEQESLLTLSDFEAMWACMGEFESLMFYNAGEKAGASQRHKHLQMVPLPLASNGPKVPIEPVLASVRFSGPVGITTDFPFRHAIAQIDPQWLHSPLEGAQRTFERYRTLLYTVGLLDETDRVRNGSPGPYNLLVTRQWMMLVPRSEEFFEGISVNALGFAGALLVKDEHQMNILKERGPMTALQRVAVTADCPSRLYEDS